jgi:hypothetical protein
MSVKADQAQDVLFGAGGLLSAAKEFLGREKAPEHNQSFFEVERHARSLWWYEVSLIPGLLQTEAYMRALFQSHWPPVDDATVEERTVKRLERQLILEKQPPVAMSFVVHEAALRTLPGGREAQLSQLQRLLEVGVLRHMTLQVLPFESAAAVGTSGMMIVLEDEVGVRHAYSVGQSVRQLTTETEVVRTHIERLGLVRTAALDARESCRFLKRMVDEL